MKEIIIRRISTQKPQSKSSLKKITKENRVKTITIRNRSNKEIYKLKHNICRVCYGDEDDGGPLISPCTCTGGLKYIHLYCLQKWLNTKVINRDENSNQSYLEFKIYRKKCEICNTPFPEFIYSKKNNKLYKIFDCLNIQFKNYISFEKIYNEDLDNTERTIYVLNCDKKNNFILGRNKDCDMRIDDVSVSRTHLNLLIDKKNKTIKIRDKVSKFGTGILVQNKKLNINEQLILYIQIGNTLLKLIKKLSFCCSFLCCLTSNKLTPEKWNLIYGKQNQESIAEVQNIDSLKYNNFSEDNSSNSNEENINNVETKNNYVNENGISYFNNNYYKINKRSTNVRINSISESENRELNNVYEFSCERKSISLYESSKDHRILKLNHSDKS